MVQNLYSKKLKVYSGELSTEIRHSIQNIKSLLNKRKLDILEWDENSVAISVVLKIQLPPRGNYQDIDIREKEPVLIVFNKLSYPYKAPRAFSDRLDFPKKKTGTSICVKNWKACTFLFDQRKLRRMVC